MTREDYERVIEKYHQLINERDNLRQEERRLAKLEENKAMLERDLNVQAYVSILEQINEIKAKHSEACKTDDMILELASKEVNFNEHGIYICMGTYGYASDFDCVHGSGVIELANDEENFGWKLYKSIELNSSQADRQMTKSNFRTFEAQNMIIYPPSDISAGVFYKKVRKEFFEALVHFGIEHAVETVKNNYTKVPSEIKDYKLIKK